jgi:hypothetical protein
VARVVGIVVWVEIDGVGVAESNEDGAAWRLQRRLEFAVKLGRARRRRREQSSDCDCRLMMAACGG